MLLLLFQRGPTHEIAGSASFVISPAADLTGTADVAGNATVTFSGVGNLGPIQEMEGSASFSLAAAAELSPKAYMVGTVSIQLVAAAELGPKAYLVGNADVSIALTGNLVGTSDLAGGASFAVTPDADLVGTADFAGAIDFSIQGFGRMRATNIKVRPPDKRINPFTGLNDRGFPEGPYIDVEEKAYVLALADFAIPYPWVAKSVEFWYDAADGTNPLVKIVVQHFTTFEERIHYVNVPDNGFEPWGGPVGPTIAAWLKATYS